MAVMAPVSQWVSLSPILLTHTPLNLSLPGSLAYSLPNYLPSFSKTWCPPLGKSSGKANTSRGLRDSNPAHPSISPFLSALIVLTLSRSLKHVMLPCHRTCALARSNPPVYFVACATITFVLICANHWYVFLIRQKSEAVLIFSFLLYP